MMDAKEYLKSFREADERIQLKIRQVKDLQERLTSISVPMDKEAVSHTPNVEIMADTVALILDLQREIDGQSAELINRKRELYGILDQIEPTGAALLTEHFLQGKSLAEVGRIHHYERRWAKRRIAGAVAELQAVLDQRAEKTTDITHPNKGGIVA